MKKSNILKASLLLGVVVAASSCTEEKIYGIDPNAIPQASDYAVKVEVNQETNQVNLSLTDKNGNPAMGVYPVWKVYTKNNPVLSTRPVYTDIITVAGDYDVEVQVANHHGISDGVQTGTIHIENTLVDFSPYILFLTNNESKVWQIAANEQGHLGCGEPGTDGLNWWSAAPYDKKDWGVYDNRMTFADNGGNSTGLYTYDPGTSGTIYINKEITDLDPYSSYNPNDDNDYCAPAEKQETTFTLSPEGVDLFLVLPQGTLMGYLPNMDQWNNPKWKIININKNKVELVCDNGGIAWHYTLQPEGADAADKPFTGFKYDSDYNLMKSIEGEVETHFWYAPGWNQIADPELTREGNRTFTFSLPEATSDQWQAQFNFKTGIKTNENTLYDVSVILNSSKDMPGATFKLTDEQPKADGNGTEDVGAIIEKREALSAMEDHVIWIHNAQGINSDNLKVVFDFGGNEAGTTVTIKDIVIKDAANDDGTVLPDDSETPGSDVTWSDVDSDANLYNQIAGDVEVHFWYAPGWNQIADPELTREGNRSFSFSLPEATTDQWQAQFNFKTGITIDPEKTYDIKCIVVSTQDLPGATFKLTHEQPKADNPAETEDVGELAMSREAIEAYEEHEFSYVNMPGIATDNLKVVFDFGGNPANTTVTIKDILIQEHQGGTGSGNSVNWVDPASSDNLYNLINGDAETHFWYAPGWNQIADPELERDGNKSFKFTLSEATTDQWQAQFNFKTGITIDPEKFYDVRCTITSTQDVPGATFKLTHEQPKADNPAETEDVGELAMSREALEAYEEHVFSYVNMPGIATDNLKVVFDFGSNPANTTITIKDIIIQEHK